MKKFKIHPITRKRLQRFRQVRYAWWAFILLMALYGLSLFSELLCNNKPLLVRHEGKSYFPFLKYYPEDTFIGSGRMTRPNYKQISNLPAFADNPANRMVFALFPYGARETLKPEDIDIEKRVDVRFMAQPSAAVLYLESGAIIDRVRASGLPFELRSGEALQCSDAFRHALENRLGKGVGEEFREGFEIGERRFELILPGTVSSESSGAVRVFLNEKLLSLAPMRWKDGEWKATSPNWQSISEEERVRIEKEAQLAAGGIDRETEVVVSGVTYTVEFTTEQIVFPFRPCNGHPLGLDSSGRDVFTLLLYGMRIAFSFGILLVLSAMMLGTLIGAVQGYYAGKVDIIVQRLIEIWQAMPFLYILILIGSVLGRSFSMLLILYGIFNWIGISYYMRAEFLKLRKMPFVEAASCMGVRPMKIMMRHMLPNALVPLVTFFPFSLVGAISVLAALDYLGFGLPAGTPSWGELLAQAQQFRYAWWLILYLSLALFVVMLLGVFVGEGVRTAFDPRQYSRMEG
jgi:microcin C transport system permease protein